MTALQSLTAKAMINKKEKVYKIILDALQMLLKGDKDYLNAAGKQFKNLIPSYNLEDLTYSDIIDLNVNILNSSDIDEEEESIFNKLKPKLKTHIKNPFTSFLKDLLNNTLITLNLMIEDPFGEDFQNFLEENNLEGLLENTADSLLKNIF